MQGDQVLLFFAVVSFLAGASAVLKTRTMQNTIDQQGELITVLEKRIDAEEREHTITKSKSMEQAKVVGQQQQQIEVLTNTANSGDKIEALDTHLTEHHNEAMAKFDEMHRDMVALRDEVTT